MNTSRLTALRAGRLLRQAALAVALVSTATAAPRFVVKFADRDGSILIPGDSQAPGHDGWIDALAFGQGVNRPAGETFVDKTDFTFHKSMDSASPLLAQYAINGNSIASVTIKYLGDTASRLPTEPVCVELRHVRVDGHRVGGGNFNLLGGNAGPRPVEEVTLVWSEVELRYRDYDEDGSLREESGTGFVAYASTEDPDFDDDGDGLSNPEDPDDDNDKVTDEYELEHGMDPFLADGDDDLDGDKRSNYDESVAGTRADDRRDFFRIDSVIHRSTPEGPEAAVTLRVKPGRHYRLLATADLSQPRDAWMVVDQFEVSEEDGDAPVEVILQGPLVAHAGRLFFAAEVELAP